MIFTRVAYRKWFVPKSGAKPYLRETKAGTSLMKMMGEAIKAGKAVEFTQHPPIDGGTSPDTGKKIPHKSGVYDQISLTITEQP